MRWTAALLSLALLTACGDDATSGSGPLSPGEILAALGAKGRAGRTPEQLDAYRATFGVLDTDGSGSVSVDEYVENSIFPSEASARGVFAATDRDGDGAVSPQEYIDNRIITDEANEIFFSLDQSGDAAVTIDEMRIGSSLRRGDLADAFARLDTSGDGAIHQIELLLTWGNWARLPEVDLANT